MQEKLLRREGGFYLVLMVLFQLKESLILTGLIRENHRGENSRQTAGKAHITHQKNPIKTRTTH